MGWLRSGPFSCKLIAAYRKQSDTNLARYSPEEENRQLEKLCYQVDSVHPTQQLINSVRSYLPAVSYTPNGVLTLPDMRHYELPRARSTTLTGARLYRSNTSRQKPDNWIIPVLQKTRRIKT